MGVGCHALLQSLSRWELMQFRWTAGRAGGYWRVCKTRLARAQGHTGSSGGATFLTSRKRSQHKRKKKKKVSKCFCFILLSISPPLKPFLMLQTHASRPEVPWTTILCHLDSHACIKMSLQALRTSGFHSKFPLTLPGAGTR